MKWPKYFINAFVSHFKEFIIQIELETILQRSICGSYLVCNKVKSPKRTLIDFMAVLC